MNVKNKTHELQQRTPMPPSNRLWSSSHALFSMLTLMISCHCLATGNATAATQEKPNILLIISEDNGQELGCYGNRCVRTPVLNKLAEDGVRFHNAYVPQAGCSQSRAAYLTGLYPHQNGQIGLATWKLRMYDEHQPNLVRSLHEAGYRTGIIGKLHVNPATAFPFDMHKIPSSNFNRKQLGRYAIEAGDFFKQSSQPFFLTVNYPDAHRPFIDQIAGIPTEPLTGKDVEAIDYFGIDSPQLRRETANYYNCMNRLDHMIGELLEQLDNSGKADQTLVVYFGDHGADLLRGKRTSYEGGLRVPLIVRWPGNTQPGTVRNELVSTLDLMPTLLQAAGITQPKGLPGRSLKPLMKEGKSKWRDYLFTEYHLHSAHNFFPQRTVRDERYKLIQNLLPGQINPGYAFTLNRFFNGLPELIESASPEVQAAYRRMEKPPEFELYDLREDPFEFRNLALQSEHAETLTRLNRELDSWRESTRDPLLDPENLSLLEKEVNACMVDGKPSKQDLHWTYPDYFFKLNQ